jgi:hypothetical protein
VAILIGLRMSKVQNDAAPDVHAVGHIECDQLGAP